LGLRLNGLLQPLLDLNRVVQQSDIVKCLLRLRVAAP
jgi:hypothetical protein